MIYIIIVITCYYCKLFKKKKKKTTTLVYLLNLFNCMLPGTHRTPVSLWFWRQICNRGIKLENMRFTTEISNILMELLIFPSVLSWSYVSAWLSGWPFISLYKQCVCLYMHALPFRWNKSLLKSHLYLFLHGQESQVNHQQIDFLCLQNKT